MISTKRQLTAKLYSFFDIITLSGLKNEKLGERVSVMDKKHMRAFAYSEKYDFVGATLTHLITTLPRKLFPKTYLWINGLRKCVWKT